MLNNYSLNLQSPESAQAEVRSHNLQFAICYKAFRGNPKRRVSNGELHSNPEIVFTCCLLTKSLLLLSLHPSLRRMDSSPGGPTLPRFISDLTRLLQDLGQALTKNPNSDSAEIPDDLKRVKDSLEKSVRFYEYIARYQEQHPHLRLQVFKIF